MVALVLAAGRPLAVRLSGGGDICKSDALRGLMGVGGERQRWRWASLMSVGAGRRRGNDAAALLLEALRLLTVQFCGDVDVCGSDTLGSRRSSAAFGSLAALGGAILR